MRIILITTAIVALPLMALGQAAEPQQTAAQGQTKEKQEATPAKKKKAHAAQEAGKPQTGTEMRGETKVQGGAKEGTKTEAGTRSNKSQTKVKSTSQTKVNVQEFKSRHREVFTLGRHRKEFFIERFGANHFRLIGNTYFAFVDGCWVAVDVAGFVYAERVICPGDPEFIVVY
jgi:hypothetical protein